MAEVQLQTRKTAIFWIVVSVSILVGAICLLSWITVMGGFIDLENIVAQRNIERSQEVIANRLKEMAVQITDWTVWDDSYRFIVDSNEEYISSNVPANLLEQLRLDAIAFINVSGEVVFAKTASGSSRVNCVLEGMERHLAKGGFFVTHPDEKSSRKGIVMLRGGPLMMVSQPIVKSDGSGPSRGCIVFAKYLDTNELRRLSSIIKVGMEIQKDNPVSLPSDFLEAAAAFARGKETFIKARDEKNIYGYSTLGSVSGNSDLILKVGFPREITQFGRQALRYFMVAMMVVGFVFGAAVYMPLSREITRRRRAEKQLIVLKNRFEQVAECSREIIWEVDAAGMHTYISQSVKDSLGYDPEEIIGKKTFFDMHPEEGRDAFREKILGIFSRKQHFLNEENCVLTKDGRIVWLITNGLPVINERGDLVGYRGSDFDITIRKQAEEMLLKAKEAAEAATRSKSNFLANMSHEIRTLMNAVLGFSELLENTPLSDKQAEYLRIVQSSGHLLLEIINNILDVSKFESGEFVLETIDFNLDNLCRDALKICLPKLEGKPVEAFMKIQHDIPVHLKGDPTRLQQVLVNLLANASKFTRSGSVGIKVGADMNEMVDGMVPLCIHVVDTGIGIPEEKCQMIFQPFTQVDESVTRKFGGTGLGLSICKAIVAAYGGKIWVESEIGKGSDFIFTLRLKVSEGVGAGDAHSLPVCELVGRKVLIVENKAPCQEILRYYCESAGMTVGGVYENCQSAVEAVKQLSGTVAFPDLIIFGLVMFEKDIDCWLHDFKEFGDLKTVVFSSDPGVTSKDALDSGFDGYVSRPFTRYDFYEALKTALASKRQNTFKGRKNFFADGFGVGIRILVAEDDLNSQKLMTEYMQVLGCVCDFVNNGQEAITRLKVHAYDLCFMDVQMPVMDGLTATGIIRK